MLFGEVFEGFFGDLLVGSGQESRHSFQNGHIGTNAVPYRTHFQTDHAGTDDAELGRYRSQVQRAFVVQHVYVINRDLRQRTRYGTGSDNHMLGFHHAFLAFVVHFNLVQITVFADKRTFAVQAFYFVLFKQESHAAGELVDDTVFALHHFGGIKFYVAHADAVFGKIVLRRMEMLARLQQCFRGNTTHVQAGTA